MDDEERDLSCDGVFLAIGHIPNTPFFAGQIECNLKRHILADGVNTKNPGLFAAGNC
jgi:thioredoxin reductase (NADPH)